MEAYFRSKSYRTVQLEYKLKYDLTHIRHAPSIDRINAWVNKFREHGSVENRNSKKTGGTHSGRKTKRTEDTLARVNASVEADPTTSVRRRAQELNATEVIHTTIKLN